MDNISAHIGQNLAALRKRKGLSLDRASELTGVSKAMLGQIERGDSSPTVNTLWKIATGLHTSFSELIAEKKPPVHFLPAEDLSPLVIDQGEGLTVFSLFPFEQDRRFEILTVILDPGALHTSEPHDEGAEEYILMTEGEMLLQISQDEYRMKTGDSLRFLACHSHTYRNPLNRPARFHVLIHYPTLT